MANKILKTRVQNKCDTAANWKLATNFKPLKGEIILYTDTKQIKVGDGNTLVNALPFYPSGDVKAAGNNTFTGTNTFSSGNLQVGNDSAHITLNDNGIESGSLRLILDGSSTGTFNYKFPCNKTVDESPVNIVTENENNTFSGNNTVSGSLDVTGNFSVSDSDGNSVKLVVNSSVMDNDDIDITLPSVAGTLALTSYVKANPTAAATTPIARLQIGDTVYSLPSGGSSTTIISKTISAWPTVTTPVTISFTTDENNKISNKDTFKNTIIQVKVADNNYVCLYPSSYGNIIYKFASSGDTYTLIITGGVGSMTYTKPAEIAGNNTFTGSNTFSTVEVQTDAQTYTTISPTNISGKSGGTSYSLVLPVKTSILATLDDLSSLFTYADNTLTINI